MNEFKYLPDLSNLFSYQSIKFKREPGWLLINAIAKAFSDDFVALQVILAIIVNSTFFWFLKKYTKYNFTAVLVYYTFFYCYVNFEILRESLALCVFMFSFESLKNKRYKRYYCYALVAVFFHISAIILFLFPLLYNRAKTINRKVFIYPIIIFVIGLLLNQLVPGIFQEITFSSILSQKIKAYNSYSFSIFGILSSLLYYIVTPLFFINVLKKQKSLIWILPMLVIYTIIGASSTLYTIFFRFLNYIIPFYILILTEYFLYIYHKGKNYNVNYRTVIFSFMFVFFVFNNRYLRAYKEDPSIRWYSHWYPYTSVFNKVDNPAREKIYIKGWDYE